MGSVLQIGVPMYITLTELQAIKDGLDLIYYCDDLPEDKRLIFRKALSTHELILGRTKIEHERRRIRQNKKRQSRRLTGATWKRYSLQIGENTPLIYFDDPKEIEAQFGIRIKNKYACAWEREIRRQLGRVDVWIVAQDNNKVRHAKEKKANKDAGIIRKHGAGKKREPESFSGVVLPDLTNDN